MAIVTENQQALSGTKLLQENMKNRTATYGELKLPSRYNRLMARSGEVIEKLQAATSTGEQTAVWDIVLSELLEQVHTIFPHIDVSFEESAIMIEGRIDGAYIFRKLASEATTFTDQDIALSIYIEHGEYTSELLSQLWSRLDDAEKLAADISSAVQNAMHPNDE